MYIPYINLISDSKLRLAIKMFLKEYGFMLHYMPSSFTGKYHSKDEIGEEGLIIHTNKVCWFIVRMSEDYGWDQATLDKMLIAALFHDSGKVLQTEGESILEYRGKKKNRYVKLTRKMTGRDTHPYLSLRLAEKYLEKAGVDSLLIKEITSMVYCHMSHWYPWYPLPFTYEEKMLALADYLASRQELKIGTLGIVNRIKMRLNGVFKDWF